MLARQPVLPRSYQSRLLTGISLTFEHFRPPLLVVCKNEHNSEQVFPRHAPEPTYHQSMLKPLHIRPLVHTMPSSPADPVPSFTVKPPPLSDIAVRGELTSRRFKQLSIIFIVVPLIVVGHRVWKTLPRAISREQKDLRDTLSPNNCRSVVLRMVSLPPRFRLFHGLPKVVLMKLVSRLKVCGDNKSWH